MISTFETDTVIMVPPVGFAFNEQTAASNAYQHKSAAVDIGQMAMEEFHGMVALLASNGIRVLPLPLDAHLPDAVFPNNWFTTHVNSAGLTDIILYPMLTPNRQAEVQPERLLAVLRKANIKYGEIIDLRSKPNVVLEGTGSLVFDRRNKRVYANLSERTQTAMVEWVAALLDYQAILFHAFDTKQRAIYHTNVMLALSDEMAIVCLDSIHDADERKAVIASLLETDKIIIDITQDQVNHMCGNVLALRHPQGHAILVLSQQAYDHFTDAQIKQMQQSATLLPVSINTIETIGGGSARCMMAEIFYS